MKKKTIIIAATCFLWLGLSATATAASWRVYHEARASAHFKDLNGAMADSRVHDGDTIYLDRGCILTTAQTISKRVKVIGPGFLIGEDNSEEARLTAQTDILAGGVTLTGLHTANVRIRDIGITIERCRITGNIIGNVNEENDEAAIRSCFIVGTIIGHEDGAYEWTLQNNLMYNSGETNIVRDLHWATIDHNAIVHQAKAYGSYWNYASLYWVSNSTITNNIVFQTDGKCISEYMANSGNTVSRNVMNTSLADYPDNMACEHLSEIFACNGQPGDSQQYYSLVENCSAIGYAGDGGDCGPWSGPHPYILNGYPLYVPRFEMLEVPSRTNSGTLQVKLSIKNQNL